MRYVYIHNYTYMYIFLLSRCAQFSVASPAGQQGTFPRPAEPGFPRANNNGALEGSPFWAISMPTMKKYYDFKKLRARAQNRFYFCLTRRIFLPVWVANDINVCMRGEENLQIFMKRGESPGSAGIEPIILPLM